MNHHPEGLHGGADVSAPRYRRDVTPTATHAAIDVLYAGDDRGSSRLLRRTFHTEARQLSPPQAATRFARTVLLPGKAVILDTETVSMGGAVVEIAVVDAADGRTLLNTLVNPQTLSRCGLL